MSRAYPLTAHPILIFALTDGSAQLSQVPLPQDQVLGRDAVSELQEIQQFEPVRLPGPRSEGCHF